MTEGLDSGNVRKLRIQTPEETERVREGRIASLLTRIHERERELPDLPQRIENLKTSLSRYEISELENMLLTSLPPNWENANESDTRYWIAIGYTLEEKYTERRQMQSGRE